MQKEAISNRFHAITDTHWDIVIIGGGATGLGAALDSATRGYKTLLLEQYDFGKGTSSRSTKLVHGGVRYLQQGNIKLVREALRERGYLLQNAPHLTSTQPFIVPVFSLWEKFYYSTGLRIYDLLSGKLSLGKTQVLGRKKTLAHLPALNPEKLSGGVLYYDGQFDDARLCTDLAVTASENGALLLNYTTVTGLLKTTNRISGLVCIDQLTNEQYTIQAKSVINATGVFTDAILRMDDAQKHEMVSPSQGIHLVVDASFFPGSDAMMIPKTDDGRVLFAVPWHNKVVLGTTDTPVSEILAEPRPLEEEIDFIIHHFNRYTTQTITRKDVKAIFAGLRPLVKTKSAGKTSLLARDHTLVISNSGLVTITGGKWTTYRRMAEDAVDNAVFIAKLEKRECLTKNMRIGDEQKRQERINAIVKEEPMLAENIHPSFPYRMADAVCACRFEMAKTLEDILARRTRILFLDAAAAIEVAAKLASLMKQELNHSSEWEKQQVADFTALAQQYLLR